VVKNKVAPPFKTVEFDIMYGTGISKEGDVLDMGADLEVIQKSGSWYSFEGERMGQGRENSKEYLKNNPEIYNICAVRIREKINAKNENVDEIKLDTIRETD
jgi:recombination protein RecA